MKLLHSSALPARALDLLQTDGGWLTTEGIALELQAEPKSVDRALQRLRSRGMIQSKTVWLAGRNRNQEAEHKVTTGTRALDRRQEWKA